MYVSCSTRCFSKEPLESALRHIADLEFHKVDLSVDQDGPHLRPCDLLEDLDGALGRVRYSAGLTCSALDLDFGDVPLKLLRKRFEAACRMAKGLTLAVITIPAAPVGSPLHDEIDRLSELADFANRQGMVLSVLTHSRTLTADPKAALALCRSVKGLGITLDPSHYVNVPTQAVDDLLPYVQNVQLRDTGKKEGEFQVRIGQGKLEYGRLITLLERAGYARGLTVCVRDDLGSAFDVEVEVRKLKLLLESLL